jgi:hypothetical protein
VRNIIRTEPPGEKLAASVPDMACGLAQESPMAREALVVPLGKIIMSWSTFLLNVMSSAGTFGVFAAFLCDFSLHVSMELLVGSRRNNDV